MAHEISLRKDGFAEIAYVGETPWHGLGQQLHDGATIEEWRIAAGMDWQIERAPVQYRVKTDTGAAYIKVPDRDVLIRSDTKAALGIVSDGYREVHPGETLEFFRDLVAAYDFKLDVAGCLFGGKRFWALAKTGDVDWVADRRDTIGGFLLLATSADGSLATLAKKTTVRVVCNNTLGMARAGAGEQMKISHRMKFDANKVKNDLGIMRQTFAEFMQTMRDLAAVKLSPITARKIVCDLFPTTKKDKATGELVSPLHTFPVTSVLDLYAGKARGSDFAGVASTGYGLLQAVTQFVDHEARSHNNDNRLNSAWFGRGSDLKDEAVAKIFEAA